MFIRNYQIHNVLLVYQKQLIHELLNQKHKRSLPPVLGSNFINVNKRQYIINKVASNVLEKIILLEIDHRLTGNLNIGSTGNLNLNQNADPKGINEFSYNLINQRNKKIRNSLKVDNSNNISEFKGKLLQRSNY